MFFVPLNNVVDVPKTAGQFVFNTLAFTRWAFAMSKLSYMHTYAVTPRRYLTTAAKRALLSFVRFSDLRFIHRFVSGLGFVLLYASRRGRSFSQPLDKIRQWHKRQTLTLFFPQPAS